MAGINKKSSRYNVISYTAGGILEVVFPDTQPNVLQIQNMGSATVYITGSDRPSVSDTNFDVQIVTLGKNVWTVPKGIKSIFIYSTADATLYVNSFESDEMYSADLDKTQETIITNSTTTSGVTIADGASVALGAKSNTKVVDPSASGSLIALTKGVLSKIIDLITATVLPSALTAGGNLKTAVQEALPAGINNIGDVDVLTLPALPAGTNNIGDVDVLTLPALPAGTNNIGDVDVLTVPTSIEPPTTPTIYNTTMTNANTEYSQLLPDGTKKISIAVIDGQDTYNYRLAFETLKVATPTAPYIKRNGNIEYNIDGVNLTSQTLYFACSAAGKVLEITCWN